MKHSLQKWLCAVMVSGAISGSGALVVHADTPIPVVIDGKTQTFDQSPVMINNRMLVPMRGIFEALGAQVQWNASNPSLVVASKGSTTITLTIGSTTAYKNGQAMTLDVAPQMVHDRTMVPIRFVSEALGADVQWDASKHTVTVNSSGTTGNDTPPSTGQDLTVEQVGTYSKSVVEVEIFNQDGKETATGSGFVVSADGKIITNYHVIDGASSVKVVFPDKTTYTTSTVLLADEKQDLAELKIDASNLTPLTLGDSSQLQLGQAVVAIGSPEGLQNTLSTGVVSTVSRQEDNGQSYIQTTAPIDHGSSGGALFNMHGEVVGVTSYGYESTANLNLAIPSNVVKQFLQGTEKLESLDTLFPKLDAAQMKDDLNKKYGTFTEKSNTFHFNIDTSYASDGKSMNITATLTDLGEYKSMTDLEANDDAIMEGYLMLLMLDAQEKGAANPLVKINGDFKVSAKLAGIPDSEFTALPSGGYEWLHTIAYASQNDATGVMKMEIEPDLNDSSTQ